MHQATPTARELDLIRALRAIVAETMAYPPVRPLDSESHLPVELINQAQAALSQFCLAVPSNAAMMVASNGVSA